jgi:hypothetical protein
MYASLPVLWVVLGMHLDMDAMASFIQAKLRQDLERWMNDNSIVRASR